MNAYLVPAVAVLAGVGVAAGIATAPSAVLDGAIGNSGLAALLPGAAAPIGATGRTMLALGAGGLVAAGGFVGRLKQRLLSTGAPHAAADADAPPVIRRADAHPDAPPRRPIRASSDLGQPLPIEALTERIVVPAGERAIPDDLDLPLAAFDPAALPLRPRTPVPVVAPLATLPPVREAAPSWLDLSDDDEAIAGMVEEKPVPQPEVATAVPEPPVAEEEDRPLDPVLVAPTDASQDDSIAALLARLERSAARLPRPAPPAPAPAPEPEASLNETLRSLRRLATG